MKIWHISDTHTFHNSIYQPEMVDMVIFSGDCANPQELLINELEVRKFIDWYSSLPIKYKIFVAGNHDLSIEKNRVKRSDFTDKGIIYLENEDIVIEGIKIWGSPVTPAFGLGWAWNRSREKINKIWEHIPDDVDILVTHGPPKGILDLTYDLNNELKLCGCSALDKRIEKIKPKMVLFGHIHDHPKGLKNAGILHRNGITYSNGSVVVDGKFDLGAVNNGNVIKYLT